MRRSARNSTSSSLTTIIYGGAPMPEPVLERALAAFGPIFVQIYGLTEAPHPDLVLSKRDHLADRRTGPARGFRGTAASIAVTGRTAVGVQLKLVDDGGREVAPGEVGEIAIAGDHVMACYWNDPAATAETLKDGWCLTGDLARADADGFYTIVDRKKEMIISGGYNVYPREVEDALYRLKASPNAPSSARRIRSGARRSARSSSPRRPIRSTKPRSARIARASWPATRSRGAWCSSTRCRRRRTARSTRRHCAPLSSRRRVRSRTATKILISREAGPMGFRAQACG